MTIVIQSSSYYKRDSEMTEDDTGSTIDQKVERAGGGGVIEEKMYAGFFRMNDFVNSDTREFVRPGDLQQKDVGNNLVDDKGIFVGGEAVECHWMECSSDEMSPNLLTGSTGGTPTDDTSHSQVRRDGEILDKLD